MSLFDLECDRWNSLLDSLNGFRLNNYTMDWISWEGSSDGKFSVKSLVNKLSCSLYSGGEWKSLVWRGVAPPKVEIFTWLVIRQRISLDGCGRDVLCFGVCHLSSQVIPMSSFWLGMGKVGVRSFLGSSFVEVLKFNIDGAMLSNGSKGGIGGIVRISFGACLDTFSLPIGLSPHYGGIRSN
ncbi:hypothetical protein V6N12_070004 [Hibiscus sabdariffa]|uniref:Reverse transcriptase zinc-binding domain-containing protein n=1 Tax=Hibiscus sabdariffa TaxID=183260 RepID=A0ABR2FFI6_9ROSI